MLTIRLFGGDLGNHLVFAQCDLSRPDSPVRVDYCDGGPEWVLTQDQDGNTGQNLAGFVRLLKSLAARKFDMPAEFSCSHEVLHTPHWGKENDR